MKGKAIIPLVLGLGLGLFAVRLSVNALKQARADRGAPPAITVVRAVEDIDAFSEIKPEMVETVEAVESGLIPLADRIETISEAVGRVTAKSIPAQALVLKSMLAPEGTPAGIVGRIPRGFRAVSVRIDEVTGVAYRIRPGDWVDCVVVMDVAGAGGKGRETVSEVILQHVQVAAMGYQSPMRTETGLGNGRTAKSATLLVAEADVPKLHLAATQGIITLAMRGDDDEISQHPPTATLTELRAAGDRSPQGDPAVPADGMKTMMGAAVRGNHQPHRVSTTTPRRAEGKPYSVLVVHGATGGERAPTVERITFATVRSPSIIDVSYGPPTHGASSRRGAAAFNLGKRLFDEGGAPIPGALPGQRMAPTGE